MPSLHIRDVPKKVLVGLRMRAQANRRSVQAEVREILARAADEQEAWRRFAVRAAELRAELASRPQSDSAELIRDDRDTR